MLHLGVGGLGDTDTVGDFSLGFEREVHDLVGHGPKSEPALHAAELLVQSDHERRAWRLGRGRPETQWVR